GDGGHGCEIAPTFLHAQDLAHGLDDAAGGKLRERTLHPVDERTPVEELLDIGFGQGDEHALFASTFRPRFGRNMCRLPTRRTIAGSEPPTSSHREGYANV